ncbi:MAG: glycosyltransferase family 2 protein [Acidobacteria bacterium]|nr:glycosyltransferase family 2 protein [Acidobacteriota bacterium]MCA1651525.1 glycosyltransferase family 2 protein [Acidobacteriota bacterium]
MAPRISVLLPCFNHGGYIEDALGSVSAQTFQDYEIIVVDDGSTEPETAVRLAAVQARGTTVLRTENRGLPAARNYAARHASGDLFCALDADDRLAPTWFEKGMRLLDERPDLAFVSHLLETFGDEHWRWTPESCDLPSLLARNTVNGAALVRRGAFGAVGGYDESMRSGCEDWDLWLRLVEQGYTGAIIPEVLFHYRRRNDSMSRMMTAESSYAAPLERLIASHEAAYRTHLVDVLVSKEAEAVQLLREVSALTRDRITVLAPTLARALEERAAVSAKADRVRADLDREYQRDRLVLQAAELQREVAALRSSWSWRITAPLRRAYGWVRRSASP